MEICGHVVLTILRLVDIVLHSGGIYLLVSCNRRGRESVQQLYIINLSVTEICFSVLWLFVIPISKLVSICDNLSAIVKDIQHYAIMCIYTLVAFVFYATMIFITLDRLLAIKFALKYRIYWNIKRAKNLILVTWITGGLLFLSIVMCHEFTGFEFDIPFHMYFYTPLNFAFTILAIYTYTFIFRQYRKSVDMQTRRSRRGSAFVVFYKSRFYRPVLIILTFVLFIIIPDLIYMFIVLIQNKRSEILLSACVISYSISNITDGCLYIFLQPNIKNQLARKLNFSKTACYDITNIATLQLIHQNFATLQVIPRNLAVIRSGTVGRYLKKYSAVARTLENDNGNITLGCPEKLV